MEFPLFCLFCQVSQEIPCTRDVPLVARRKLGERSASITLFPLFLHIFVCMICMIVFIFKAIDIFYGYPSGYLFGCWEIWENASQWKCGIITDENVLWVPIWVLVSGGLLGVKEIWDGILSIFGLLFCDNKSWTGPLSFEFWHLGLLVYRWMIYACLINIMLVDRIL